MFSRRLPASWRENALSRALAETRLRGRAFIDLTETNPARAGLSPGPREIEAAFEGLPIATYEPDPRGLPQARAAVGGYASGRGLDGRPERIVLTSSTSEAYAHLFRLLADPGDDVLVPRPSYPLFEPLAALEGVKVRTYPLTQGARWTLEPDLVRAAIGRRTRAVVVVDPNNPTGSILTQEEGEALSRLCAKRGLALISDQVFADFPLHGATDSASGPPPRVTAGLPGDDAESRPLRFVLSGLSKVAGLPQLKLAWIVVDGPDRLVEESLQRLEWIADAFLSVAAPVQLALPRLLETRHAFRERTLQRVRGNLVRLRGTLEDREDFELLPPEGGWTAVIRLPRIRSEEEWALALLDRGALVHPGHFYDFEEEAYIVVSLLPEPAAFAEGIRRLAALE